MVKRVDVTVNIDLPANHNADRVSVGPDGHVKVFDKSGNEIAPKRVTRATHYNRRKGPKYQARSEDEYASVDGLEQLASCDSFVAIDTNSIEIDGTKVSAACFIALKLVAEKGEFQLKSLDERHHVYEFHQVSGNPEMLAILKVACDTVRTQGPLGRSKIAFITDSELDKHHAITTRKSPIYGAHYLPKGFKLSYASADTGQELGNKLIRICDARSSQYLKKLKNGAFRRTGLASLEQDPSVLFRYTYYPGLILQNPIIKGATITPETKCSISFE